MLFHDAISLWVILTPILPMTVQVSGQDVSALDSCSLVRPARDLSVPLLDSLGKDVLRKLKSGLEKGLDNLDSTLVRVHNRDDQWHLELTS